MTCRDAIDVIADFLDQTLPGMPGRNWRSPARLRALPGYLNTYRKTRALVGQAGRMDMPEELRRACASSCSTSSARPPA
jgi:hypothetical protein